MNNKYNNEFICCIIIILFLIQHVIMVELPMLASENLMDHQNSVHLYDNEWIIQYL